MYEILKKKKFKSWINRRLFLPSGSSSVPDRKETSADDALTFHSVGTVFICSRKESSKQTNTDTCSWIFITRNNSCCLVALLSARSGGASTRFHLVTSVCVRLDRFRVQTEAVLPLQWLQIILEVGETSDTWASFCPFAKSPNSWWQGLKTGNLWSGKRLLDKRSKIQLCWAESKIDSKNPKIHMQNQHSRRSVECVLMTGPFGSWPLRPSRWGRR